MPKLVAPLPVEKQQSTLEERNNRAEQALATRYDALNQHFTQAEQVLKLLKPPHDVWVSHNHRGCEGNRQWELLGMAKHQNKWRICHRYDYENEEGTDPVPVVECAIEIRLRAANFVGKLREAIVKAKEDYVPRVDDAIKQLATICNTPLSGKEAR